MNDEHLCEACGGSGLRLDPIEASSRMRPRSTAKPLLAYMLEAKLAKPAKTSHQIFCEAYVGEAQECKWRAAQIAGYCQVDPSIEPTAKQRKRLNKEASRLLVRADVQRYIAALDKAKSVEQTVDLTCELAGEGLGLYVTGVVALARGLMKRSHRRALNQPK